MSLDRVRNQRDGKEEKTLNLATVNKTAFATAHQ